MAAHRRRESGAERQLRAGHRACPDDLVAAARARVDPFVRGATPASWSPRLEAIAQSARPTTSRRADGSRGGLRRRSAHWPKAITALETVAKARPNDVALALGSVMAHRRHGELDVSAIAWYAKRREASRPSPSAPGFAIAQADVRTPGKLADAIRHVHEPPEVRRGCRRGRARPRRDRAAPATSRRCRVVPAQGRARAARQRLKTNARS